ncbi:MAG TPA: hypothetical protein VME40_16855 [Caulobacteraceae bacterium]|nr:hypothetical protein [Caulobacteraceae bacterium]
MRLVLALPALAGGAFLGWAGLAGAQANGPPPAAPIFYCPTPAAAAAPAKAAPAHRVRHAHCPTMREAREHRRVHGVHEHRYAAAGGDVAEAQALIYRYERAVGGLDARAVREAWQAGGEGPPPPPYAALTPPPPPDMGPPPPPPYGGMLVLRVPPANGRVGPHDGGPPPDEYRGSDRVYAWDDAEAGGRVATFGFQRRDSDSRGVWVFVDRDGERHYLHLGEAHAAPPPCPPPHDLGCTAGESFQRGDAQWRDGSYGAVYQYAGRDAQGYLVWPGKEPQ